MKKLNKTQKNLLKEITCKKLKKKIKKKLKKENKLKYIHYAISLIEERLSKTKSKLKIVS
jgi:gluconate kinase